MMRRVAVVGDELTSKGHILPYEQAHGCSFHGHKAALIGGEAYCEKCKSIGWIAKAGGPYRPKYGTTREIALDGDIVLCRCPVPPHIIATLSGESRSTDENHGLSARSYQSADNNSGEFHDEKFQLLDGKSGQPLGHVEYAIVRQTGAIEQGVTDAGGYTHLLSSTLESEMIDIYM
ncbi:PAAR domain-containing protein [Paraburkholderia adhaesiva]|uniref:PAAR domain-containing protein n=1 Tax=Paraburkholderia adhaesiva TaxID=2883244 RepID=UPI001F230C80|nr:PAAR domain-containing protein [Paraburkholderia adhaesiva]